MSPPPLLAFASDRSPLWAGCQQSPTPRQHWSTIISILALSDGCDLVPSLTRISAEAPRVLVLSSFSVPASSTNVLSEGHPEDFGFPALAHTGFTPRLLPGTRIPPEPHTLLPKAHDRHAL